MAIAAVLAFPATASADVVLGGGAFNPSPQGVTNIFLSGAIGQHGDGPAFGVTVVQATNGDRFLGVVRCVRAERNRAVFVVEYDGLTFLNAGQPQQFVGAVFYVKDNGLLGLLGPVDQARNFRLTEEQLEEFSNCSSVVPPPELPYNRISFGDFTVIDGT